MTRATSRIVVTPSSSDEQASLTLKAFSEVSVIVMATESITNLSKTNLWEGMKTDLSGEIVLGVRHAFVRSPDDRFLPQSKQILAKLCQVRPIPNSPFRR